MSAAAFKFAGQKHVSTAAAAPATAGGGDRGDISGGVREHGTVHDSGSTANLAQQMVAPVLSSHLPPAAIEPMPAEVSVSTVS